MEIGRKLCVDTIRKAWRKSMIMGGNDQLERIFKVVCRFMFHIRLLVTLDRHKIVIATKMGHFCFQLEMR